MTNTNTPSLASSAMLVELSISVWTARKLDRRASNDVTAANRAAAGVARVNKDLLAGCDELTAIQKFAGTTRTAHYSMTLPWSDTGLRMLPTAKYFDYHAELTRLQGEFDRLVEAFLAQYEWEVNEVQLKLGDMYNPTEYPSVSSIREKFAFRLNYIPLPEAGDFRVDVGNEAAREMQEKYEQFYQTQLERAMGDIWKRTYDALSRMSERLDYGDHEQKKVFRNSLVENAVEIVDIMESMNITGDANMQLQQRRLKQALVGVTPDALREDEYLRRETKQAVDDVLASLPSLDI